MNREQKKQVVQRYVESSYHVMHNLLPIEARALSVLSRVASLLVCQNRRSKIHLLVDREERVVTMTVEFAAHISVAKPPPPLTEFEKEIAEERTKSFQAYAISYIIDLREFDYLHLDDLALIRVIHGSMQAKIDKDSRG